MIQTTVLHPKHLEAGAKMVDFHGWEMPINYGSQLEEHHVVRTDAGMFDVSHMTIVDLTGERVKAFLQHLLANDVAKLTVPGKALYSGMLNPEGGVIDDLITYFLTDTFYRLVVNSATREKDLAWIRHHAIDFAVSVTERPELAMIAVQGPTPRPRRPRCSPRAECGGRRHEALLRCAGRGSLHRHHRLHRRRWLRDRGPQEKACDLWQALLDNGVAPCGLGARDTLRLEAGMNLYGQDMDESISPLAANMAWTLAWEPASRQFIGRAALEAQKAAGNQPKLVGLVMEERACCVPACRSPSPARAARHGKG